MFSMKKSQYLKNPSMATLAVMLTATNSLRRTASGRRYNQRTMPK